MTRSFRLLVVAVLAVVLALSSTQNAFASVGIAYDNGLVDGFGVDWGLGVGQAGVKFAAAVGAKLLTIRVAIAAGIGCSNPPPTPTSTFTVHVRAADAVTPLTTPFSVTVNRYCVSAMGDPATFENIDVSGRGIVLTTGDFFVILEGSGTNARLFVDNGPLFSRSYEHYDGLIDPNNPLLENLMIRAEYDRMLQPVGGFVEPVNKLVVFAPYLALFAVVASVAVVFWKKPDN